MALKIYSREAEEVVKTLAEFMGESEDQAVAIALKERLEIIERKRSDNTMLEDVREIVKRFNSLPVLDDRTADEILGYDENGLPT